MNSTAENIEQAELSKRYVEQLAGQRLRTALFTTFSFDPGFFEQEVLRLFFDIEVSHSRELRLVKLDDSLRELTARPAVYYDARALARGDVGSARLDVERHPMRLNGCFHPKIVCALVEAAELDEKDHRPQKLIVGCQSANLTRSGWWENVECCHIEIIEEETKSSFSDPLKQFLRWLIKRSPGESHLAAEEILAFLTKKVTQYERLAKEPLAPLFLFTDMKAGGRSITEMLLDETGTALRGMNLEILSPYFDEDDGNSPLDELKNSFDLDAKTLRVYLPRDEENKALVSQAVHEKYAEHWGSLPAEILRNGSGRRTVHAKVYRFFRSHPKREIWFVGSVNLTRAAHQAGGNMECGFVVERDLGGRPRPTFLIEPDQSRPSAFAPASEPLEENDRRLTHLTLQYHWSTGEARAHWALKQQFSPPLHLASSGISLGTLEPLPPDEWRPLPQDITAALKQRLESSALVTVSDSEGSSAQILVMEDGMSHKPSLLHTLSAADILRYWSMLTPEQRSAFLEERLGLLLLSAAPDDFTLKQAPFSTTQGSLFDRCAGFFHAFHTLEKSVREAIATKRLTHAITRLFGKKHDSLGHLLDRLEATNDPIQDDVDRHVILLCARQSLDYLRAAEPDFWAEHKSDATELYGRVNALRETTRSRLAAQLDEGFLTWFEKEFLRRESDHDEDD